MCGIAGIFDLAGRRDIDPARIKRMTDAIAQRGPDGAGLWRAPGIALGHRRLSIIDIDGGAQPMIDAAGETTVAFNGEIYNFQNLKRDLTAAGHVFRTRSDTEVLLAGWREWGADLPLRLDGFFAAAIWDARTETLVLLRDKWGKKPLCLAEENGLLLFGSDPAAVRAGLTGPPELCETAAADYLCYGYVPEDACIFKGMRKLPPASILIAPRGDAALAAPTRYWRPGLAPHDDGRALDHAAEELTPLLRDAVGKRLIADAPLGTFLSGGLDSAAITVLAAAQMDKPLDACTMGFDDPALDETAIAAKTAQAAGAHHHVGAGSVDPSTDLDAAVQAFAEPFADASALPTLRLCALARPHMKAALSGDGGDELFAGYRRYPFHLREEQLKARAPHVVRSAVLTPASKLYPALPRAPRWLRAKATLEALAGDQAAGLLRATAMIPPQTLTRLLTPGARRRLAGHDPSERLRRHIAAADTDDPLARAQYADLMTWLPGRMLVKVDRASMWAGVEARNPLLDLDVAEWAMALPARLKLDGFSGKRVLRAAVARQVPKAVLTERKRGFVPPLNAWLRGPLRAEAAALADSPRLRALDLVDSAALNRLWRATETGRADYSREIWTVFMLNRFLARIEA